MSSSAFQFQINSAGQTLTELLRTVYRETVPEMLHRMSTGIAGMIKPGRVINATGPNEEDGGFRIQVVRSHPDSTRVFTDASRDYGRARKMRGGNLRVRFDTADSSRNDLSRIEHIIELSMFDLKRAASAPGVAINLLETELRNTATSVDEAIERLMHADRTAIIGVVDGGKKASGDRYDTASAYSNGATIARIKVKSYSIAMFKPGHFLDILDTTGATTRINEVEVMHVDEEENSLLIQRSDRTDAAYTNLDSIVDTDIIVRSGEYNQGFKGGFGNLFQTTYSSSADTFFGGVNRGAADYMWLIPIRTRVASSTAPAPMSQEILDDLGDALGFRMGKDQVQTPTLIANTRTVTKWRNNAAQGTMTTREQGNREVGTGNSGLFAVHPELGQIRVMGTKNARPDRAILAYMDTFEMLFGEFSGFEYTSGTGDNVFRQVIGSNNTHGGGSVHYRAEGVMFGAPISTDVMGSACAFNLS